LKSQYGHLRTHQGKCTYSASGGVVSAGIAALYTSESVRGPRAISAPNMSRTSPIAAAAPSGGIVNPTSRPMLAAISGMPMSR